MNCPTAKHGVWIAICLMIALAAALFAGCTSRFDFLVNIQSVSPAAKDCGECHVTIYEEWKESAHAHSFVDEKFREATNDHQFERCMGCHVPETIYEKGIPKARHYRREEGVTCISCHLYKGQMKGPVRTSAKVVPHPVFEKDPILLHAEACGKCHRGTYKEWSSVQGEKKQCQECHMKEITRKVTQPTDWFSLILVNFEQESRMRAHKFERSAMKDFKEVVVVDIASKKGDPLKAIVKITNKLPHNIPTGDFGFREAVLDVTFMDGDGKEIERLHRSFFQELDSAIPAGDASSIELDIPTGSEFISFEFYRAGEDGSGRIDLAHGSYMLP